MNFILRLIRRVAAAVVFIKGFGLGSRAEKGGPVFIGFGIKKKGKGRKR